MRMVSLGIPFFFLFLLFFRKLNLLHDCYPEMLWKDNTRPRIPHYHLVCCTARQNLERLITVSLQGFLGRHQLEEHRNTVITFFKLRNEQCTHSLNLLSRTPVGIHNQIDHLRNAHNTVLVWLLYN